jgi:hypothetical protein
MSDGDVIEVSRPLDRPGRLNRRGASQRPISLKRDLGTLDFGTLATSLRPAMLIGIQLWGLFWAAGSVTLLWRQPAYTLPLAVIAGGSCLLALTWLLADGRRGLPILPLLAFQFGICYGLPLLTRNAELLAYSDELLWPCVRAFSLHIAAIACGWLLLRNVCRSLPARVRFGLPSGVTQWNEALGRTGTLLLGFSLGFELLLFSGLYWSLLPGLGDQLLSVVRQFTEASMISGAFLGGFAGASRRGRLVYWTLIVLMIGLKTTGILLSASMGLVIAVGFGCLFGARRIPWTFLAIAFSVMAFLNQSKFVMRERYWYDADGDRMSLSLMQLPAFYSEWVRESAAMLLPASGAGSSKASSITEPEDHGQSFLDRINNLQNLLFVTEAMTVHGTLPLEGEGYASIPSLLVPRLLWPDKPRAHEGQILLNLHFGRQVDEEATETTYVAWGLLPEAAGNFGAFYGPLLVGFVLGAFVGGVEAWSQRKQVLSIDGLVALTLLLQITISFEMNASVLITSTFQVLVAVLITGIIIRVFILNGRPSEMKTR